MEPHQPSPNTPSTEPIAEPSAEAVLRDIAKIREELKSSETQNVPTAVPLIPAQAEPQKAPEVVPSPPPPKLEPKKEPIQAPLPPNSALPKLSGGTLRSLRLFHRSRLFHFRRNCHTAVTAPYIMALRGSDYRHCHYHSCPHCRRFIFWGANSRVKMPRKALLCLFKRKFPRI